MEIMNAINDSLILTKASNKRVRKPIQVRRLSSGVLVTETRTFREIRVIRDAPEKKRAIAKLIYS